jgi:phenylacetate-CoA ligase
MSTDRPYWNMSIEPFLNTAEMKKLQLEKLKIMLRRLYVNAPFYKKRIDDAKLDIERLNSLGDYSKAIPIYDKKLYRQRVDECGGDLIRLIDEELPCSIHDLIMISSTTGTTGEPQPYPFTYNDVYNMWGEYLCRGAWRAGLRKEDIVLHAFALSMVIAGVSIVMGIQKMGVTVLPVGAEVGTDRVLKIASYFKPSAFMGTPSLASYLVDVAEEKIGRSTKSLGIKKLFCAGESGAGIPGIRKKLEDGFGAKVFDFGAALGMSCDHSEYQGMHNLTDDIAIYELVDPDTKEPIKLEDGARGELVLTVIEGDGQAYLRKSMGDIHEVMVSPCPCGKTGFRYKVAGRVDDMLKVKGIIVYPEAVSNLLQRFVPKITGEFRLVLTERPPLVVPPLKIKLEMGVNYPKDRLEALENELLDEFHRKMTIRPRIIWVEPGDLERSTYKGAKFEKLYK